jgi:hypothetical protein
VSSASGMVVMLASIASEAAMGVGSAVCMMVEGARRVKDGLRRSARKERRKSGQHEQQVSSLAPEQGRGGERVEHKKGDVQVDTFVF